MNDMLGWLRECIEEYEGERKDNERIAALRIELKDVLMMAYGAECNWPKLSLDALGMQGSDDD